MHSTTKATTLSPDSIERFRASLYAKGLSPLTAQAYAKDLETFLLEIDQGPIPMEDFPETAANWLTGNRKIVAQKTTSRRLTSLRAFCKWARWDGSVLSEYRAPASPPTQPHPIPEGVEGLRRMVAVARKPSHRALVALGGFVGCRVAESLFVRPSHFDLEDMILKVHGKGGKIRYVPVSEEAWGILATSVTRAFLEGDAPIVGIQERVARQGITTLGKRAGLSRPVSSHDLRATFATAVYDKTKDMRLVQELLGHSSVETTQIYVGVRASQLRAAVEL